MKRYGSVLKIRPAAIESYKAYHANVWPEVLAAFQSGRCPAGNEIVELSRLLGHGLVDHPPDWATMTSEEVALFVTSLTSGRTLYMQPPRSESVVGH